MEKPELQIFYRQIDPNLEYCFYVEASETLSADEVKIISWLLAETFAPQKLSRESRLVGSPDFKIIEIGPLLNFATPFSTNAVSIIRNCGISKVTRLERSIRRRVWQQAVIPYDRMMEGIYEEPLTSFGVSLQPAKVFAVPLMEKGLAAFDELEGLSMDDHDKQTYYRYFAEKCRRNPTIVELIDLNNANSEHSRHPYFKGLHKIGGILQGRTLMDIVKSTLKANPNNSLLAFCDNSSVISGFKINTILPKNPGASSSFELQNALYHLLFTAETHNFPTGIAPTPGSETGSGGRIRDGQATGRGGLIIAGTAGYCVGNLYLPHYSLPGEADGLIYPSNLASPLEILIKASSGASDYGNKFGEPLIQGFVRTGSWVSLERERCEWLKPIMFTGGIGQIDDRHLLKKKAEKGLLIISIGGPAYRIGFGGGSASSLLQGENLERLDFNAVQRGDAEMEQKMNRVVRACVEMGDRNPIISIHDQGAGGPANVLKELVEDTGGKIDIRKIKVGDPSLSVLEIWVCEYQERNGLLIRPERLEEFQLICEREKVSCEVLGEVTGDGRFVVEDSQDGSMPVDLELKEVLGGMPQKTFSSEYLPHSYRPLRIPTDLLIIEALEDVLRLPSVGSKRFLTNKVDRSVTGLIAQQQCCGSLHLPVSDVAVVAQSHFPNYFGRYSGGAIGTGEQPIKMLVNPAAGARMAVAEALTNIVWARISKLGDIKCSANWMGAPKLPGEGAKMYDAAVAMSDFMIALSTAVDGGKDSLSMATRVNDEKGKTETVKSPLQLVISAYCTVPDITKVITPDIKAPGKSKIMLIDLANGNRRLGGSVLAQTLGQIGTDCPDIYDVGVFVNGLNFIQRAIDDNLILSGHDVSDGGMIVALLEMLFAGNCGFSGGIQSSEFLPNTLMEELFAEEAGLLIEYLPENEDLILDTLASQYIDFRILGKTILGHSSPVIITYDGQEVINLPMEKLRSCWEKTGCELEKQQCQPELAVEEFNNNFQRTGPDYHFSFSPKPNNLPENAPKFKVAIIREEGSNGDREMTSAFFQAGFDVYDVNMTDLLSGKADLADFRGIVMVGGVSYADVLGSGKGWGGVIRFNSILNKMFDDFYQRTDTFSFWVCNGCQLSSYLGRVPGGFFEFFQPRFIKNDSGRFESRFSTVTILPSPAIMLKDMIGSRLGIWVAHGEGKFFSPEEKGLDLILREKLAPIRYIDDQNKITTAYPFNPNGSAVGIAALCDPTGRHLAMMPHPERTFLNWQWAYWPPEWGEQISPWFKMFQNAYDFCLNNVK